MRFASWPTSLSRARPAACGSYTPSGSPVAGADCCLMRRAGDTCTRLDAGWRCSIKCYPRNCGVSTAVLVVLSCSRNSSTLRNWSSLVLPRARKPGPPNFAGRSPKHSVHRPRSQRALPSVLCVSGCSLPTGKEGELLACFSCGRRGYWFWVLCFFFLTSVASQALSCLTCGD